MMLLTQRPTGRRGVGAIWALVVLALVSTMAAAAIVRLASARLQVRASLHRTQAEWLLRAGSELAASKILSKPDGYTGETFSPIPGGEVRITAKPDEKEKTLWQIGISTRYEPGDRTTFTRSIERKLRRIEDGKAVRIEWLPGEP